MPDLQCGALGDGPAAGTTQGRADLDRRPASQGRPAHLAREPRLPPDSGRHPVDGAGDEPRLDQLRSHRLSDGLERRVSAGPAARTGRIGAIGGLADYHYSFMGALGDFDGLEARARELAGAMGAEGVDAALLVPV